jgi:predicted transcriptional regulator
MRKNAMGEERERNESGRFEPEFTDEEVISAVRVHEPAGTKEIADELGIARQSADYRLRRLLEEGRVSKKKVGNSLVWSIAD